MGIHLAGQAVNGAARLLWLLVLLWEGLPLGRSHAVETHLRLQRGSWLPQSADWKADVDVEGAAWALRGAWRRRDGELGALPHASAWLERRLPAGWSLSVGDHRVASATGAMAGFRRSGRPGAWDELVSVAPGSASRSSPEERGFALRRDAGALRGGFLWARSRRDQRLDGRGFVLDLERRDGNRQRHGAWRDGLELAWVTAEGPLGWEVQGAAGIRRNPLRTLPLGALQVVRRRQANRLLLAWEEGEHQLARLQLALRKRKGWIQLDAWRGRQRVDAPLHSRSALPLGSGGVGGGLHLQAGLPVESGGIATELRWLQRSVRSEDRPALRWTTELTLPPLDVLPGMRWSVRHIAAEDRPVGSGQERWRVAVEGGARTQAWHGEWEDAADSHGHTRSWSLTARRVWRGRRWTWGMGLAMAQSAGDGPVRLVPISLAPGLLIHAALTGERQLLGVGTWAERGGHRLGGGLMLRDQEGGAVRDAKLEIFWQWQES